MRELKKHAIGSSVFVISRQTSSTDPWMTMRKTCVVLPPGRCEMRGTARRRRWRGDPGVPARWGDGQLSLRLHLQEWGFWQAVDKSDGPFASSLTAGITYRIAR